MNTLLRMIFSAILMGLGATLMFDLWGMLLKYTFGIAPSNICLVGRWLSYMPEGKFHHTNITTAAAKRAECPLGWLAHYGIGVSFAGLFVALAGSGWLLHPRVIPAVLYGAVTVLAPLLIMQPAFGFGFAASKTAKPAQARLRSLMNHLVFGTGLYLFGLLATWLFATAA
jgi:hypothetical protein